MRLSEYYAWLKKDWAKAGFIISIFLFVFLFVFVREYDFIVFLLLLQTPLYMLHETEEYIFPGGFGKYFNTKILKLQTEKEPVNETFIFFVNVILIWILMPVCGLLSTIDYRFGLWIPYFSFFAGIAHILLAIKAKKIYSPGLIVSLVLNIPVGLVTILYLWHHDIIKNIFLTPHLLIGLGLNAILPVMGTILLRNYRQKERNQHKLKNAT
ncbi:MAG: HXXEE domain-containing protein [Anaerolineaceae bacterium]|nr:HXXEE domain-containing protein [Anaerolineaceae bacterium]